MNKFKKLSLVGAVSGSFLIANNVLPPYQNAWALTQDTVDELEGKKRAGSLAAIISYLLNDEDLASNDSYVVEQNTQLNVTALQGILTNDNFSPPADFVLLDTTTNGALTLAADGSFSYLPALNFTGIDSFRYGLNISSTQVSEATVTIRVNGKPEAFDDTYSTLPDTALIGNVITNSVGGSDDIFDGADIDPVTDVATSQGGSISIDANGDFTYTPPAGVSGVTDTYVYTLRDQDGEISTATIIVAINAAPVNSNPIAQTVDEDTALAFNALGTNQVSVSDVDTDLVSVTLSVTNGILSVTPAGSALAPTSGTSSVTISGSQADINATLASLAYQATAEFNGRDALTILSIDATSLTDTDTIALTVTPISDGVPIAVDDNFSTGQDEQLSDNIIVNSVGGSDTIFDEADVTPVVNAATTRGGTITINTGGSFTYNPPAGVIGGVADTFVYTLVDSDGQSDMATISINIGAPSIIIPNSNSEGPNSDDILVLENTDIAGLFTVSTPAGFGNLQIGSTTFTEAQLNAASVGAPLDITGESNGVFQVTDFTNGVVAYDYDPTGSNQDHSGATNDVLSEALSIVFTDTNSQTASDTLNIGITDTNPEAKDDERNISEGTSAIAGNTVGFAGGASGDMVDIIIDPNSSPVTDIDFGTTDGTVGTPLSGDYGSMAINSAGVYTYTLDNTNTDVQGLKDSESITDVFTYTITDGDSDTDSADIIVTIDGVEDALPTIVVKDENAGASGENSVAEATAGTITGLVTITASAGVQALTVAGQDIINATATPVVIAGSEGILTVTGFNASTGAITYSYLEDGNTEDHSGGEILDNFVIAITDYEGDSATDSLDIQIIDSTPSAVADTNSITEDAVPNTVSANVITGGAGADTGADTPLSVTAITGGTVGSSLTGTLGDLIISSQGIYTYTVNNNNATVQALANGQSASDVFTYTVTDGDGDTSSATLTISVNGESDAPVLDLDANDSSTGTGSAYVGIFDENGGGVAIAIADADTSITDVDSSNIENAVITLTNPQTDDVLSSLTLPAGITVDAASTATNIILTGSANLANYQTAIAAIRFNNTNASPSTIDRTINVTVTDASESSNIAVSTIKVLTLPEAPILVDESNTPAISTGLAFQFYNTGEVFENNASGVDANIIESTIDATPAAVEDNGRIINGFGGAEPVLGDIISSFEVESDTPIDGSDFAGGDAILLTGLVYLEQGSSYSFQGDRNDSLQVELGGTTMVTTTGNVSGNFNVANDDYFNGSSAGTTSVNSQLQTQAFTAPVDGYYTLEINFLNSHSNGDLAIALVQDGVARTVSSDNYKLYAGVDEAIVAGAQFTSFVPSLDNVDGGYFAQTLGIQRTGIQGSSIPLGSLGFDTSGTDVLTQISISNAPIGTVITDGVNTFTSTAPTDTAILALNTWDLARLTLTPPSGQTANIDLQVSATSEFAGGGAIQGVSTPVTYTIGILPTGYEGSIDTDILTATSGADALITGGAEADTLTMVSTEDRALFGFAGDDTITGGQGDNVISGGSGDDVINAGDGEDVIFSGKGNDSLTGGNLADIFTWIEGDADGSTDTITDFAQGSGGDVINLSSLLQGESTADIASFLGLSGDTLSVDVDKNGSTDLTIVLTGVTNNLSTLIADGNIVTDKLNVISGTSSSETVTGTAQAEILAGRAGSDTLTGGAGSDVFFWGPEDADGSTDTITDFTTGSSGDVLDLASVLVNEIGQEFGAFNNFNIQDYITLTTGTNTTLTIDADAIGSSTDLIIVLNGVDLSGLGGNDEAILQSLFNSGNLLVTSDLT